MPELQPPYPAAKVFTIFRETLIKIVDENRSPMGTERQEEIYSLTGGTAHGAVEEIVTNLAEAEERMEDISDDDPDYEIELSMARDDVAGEFFVYEGKLTERPDTPPLYEEGYIGAPVMTVIKRQSPAE